MRKEGEITPIMCVFSSCSFAELFIYMSSMQPQNKTNQINKQIIFWGA